MHNNMKSLLELQHSFDILKTNLHKNKHNNWLPLL